MKKRILFFVVLLVMLLAGYQAYIKQTHTYTLSDGTGFMKAEQISPVTGKVSVIGSQDTAVCFTDVETGETFEIGYITPGMGDSVRLRHGHWYRVEGAGSLTVWPVVLRIE